MSGNDGARRRATWAAAVFLAALLALGLWIADALSRRQALERCLALGRRDCGDVGASLPGATPRGYVPSR